MEGAGAPRPVVKGLALPPAEATLRSNPLIDADGAILWPSARYHAEYGAGCYWAMPTDARPFAANDVRLRRLVDLPERW